MDLQKVKKKLQNALKLSGFNVRSEFCSQLVDKFLEANVDLSSAEVFDETVKNLSGTLETQCSSGRSIEKQHIDRALEVCLRSGCDHHETVFNVINAFDFPKLYYDQDRKIYLKDTSSKSVLLPDANVKAQMFLERYSKVLQRTKRAFSGNLLNEHINPLKLQTVDYLLTLSETTLDCTLILGALLQIGNCQYALEDPTGIVNLDLTHAKYHQAFYVEGCIVLVNGRYEDKTLQVATMCKPNGEEYGRSRPTFGNLNYFGGESRVPLKDSRRLERKMAENSDGIFVLMSDVWLDHSEIFGKLEKLFEQMEQFVQPIAFVFMGNFMSECHGSEMIHHLRKQFKRLGELIARYHLLVANSQFVFVPGLEDPCTPHIVPRLELPNFITQDLTRVVPNAIFATNPCRIQYCTKEIVIFRADMLAKLRQNTLYKPPKEDTASCMAKTIISQGHLCPVSLNALNVHWDFDYCMSLYPLPDLIVIGDKSEAYQDHYKGCLVVNPGQFCTGDFGFKMYNPNADLDQAVQDCAVDVREEDMV